jgi:hypothetical protein
MENWGSLPPRWCCSAWVPRFRYDDDVIVSRNSRRDTRSKPRQIHQEQSSLWKVWDIDRFIGGDFGLCFCGFILTATTRYRAWHYGRPTQGTKCVKTFRYYHRCIGSSSVLVALLRLMQFLFLFRSQSLLTRLLLLLIPNLFPVRRLRLSWLELVMKCSPTMEQTPGCQYSHGSCMESAVEALNLCWAGEIASSRSKNFCVRKKVTGRGQDVQVEV